MTTNSSRSELCLAAASDLHLGHPRNKAPEIIKNLRTAFPDTAATGELDAIFLAGDVFDDLLSLPDNEVADIDFWIANLLRVCKKYGIVLRVLDGTKSHDWFQSQRFVAINTLMEINADVKYVKDLSIEYIDCLGIHVLYVPDEWRDDTAVTLSQVHDLLKAKGLAQVDYAIMHGQFEFQLPPHIKAPKHSSEEYLKIVRKFIFIGHDHEHKRFDRIIVQGSFDRLAHGHETPKGHVRVIARSNDEHDITFVENVGAKRFVTVRCKEMTLEETIAEIDLCVSGLPEGSLVRVEANYDNPILSNIEVLIRRYPLFTWSKLVRELEELDVEAIEDTTVFVPITITKDNISDLLMERVAGSGANVDVLEAAALILKEIL